VYRRSFDSLDGEINSAFTQCQTEQNSQRADITSSFNDIQSQIDHIWITGSSPFVSTRLSALVMPCQQHLVSTIGQVFHQLSSHG